MNALGWLLTIIGGCMAFYGGVIGTEVWGRFGTTRVMHMPTLIFGGLMLIIGVMILLAKMLGGKSTADNEATKEQTIFNGKAVLENDAYKIYLTKKFDINFNNALNKFICGDKLFDNVDEALHHAQSKDWAENDIVDGIAKEEAGQNSEHDGGLSIALRIFAVIAILITIWVLAYNN